MNQDLTPSEERLRAEARRRSMYARQDATYNSGGGATPADNIVMFEGENKNGGERYETDPTELVSRTALATFAALLMLAVTFASFNGYTLRYPTLTWLGFVGTLVVFAVQVATLTRSVLAHFEGDKHQ